MCVGPNNEIIVADTRIVVYTNGGEFVREFGGGGGGRGRYSGVAVDGRGCVLAARMEKTRCYVQVSKGLTTKRGGGKSRYYLHVSMGNHTVLANLIQKHANKMFDIIF